MQENVFKIYLCLHNTQKKPTKPSKDGGQSCIVYAFHLACFSDVMKTCTLIVMI